MSLTDVAFKVLKKYPLCDNCLGRQFALLLKGLSNSQRGFCIKLLLAMEAHRLIRIGEQERGVDILRVLYSNGFFKYAKDVLTDLGIKVDELHTKSCFLCGGIFSELDELADMVVKAVSEYEFSTFLIGSHVPPLLVEREDTIRSEFNLEFGESLKSEFNRELGKKVQSLTGKVVDFFSPDLVIIVDLESREVKVKSSPLFIYGRYRKLVRGIPQCKWICSSCGGVGCEKCGYTGKKYPISIEEIVAGPSLELTLGKSAVFHGAGREDIDARMLGRGRPFIIEIKEPKKRFIDLKKLEQRINEVGQGKVEVLDLRFATRSEIRKLKMMAQIVEKTYRVLVKLESEVSEERLKKLEEFFRNREIRQRTPLRVLYRRADRVRIKKVYELKVKRLKPNLVEMIIRCQGGLYVKELINGDKGRTRPNVADFLGTGAECVELDVLDVAG